MNRHCQRAIYLLGGLSILWLVLISPPAQSLWRLAAVHALRGAAGGAVELDGFGTNLLNRVECRGLSWRSGGDRRHRLDIARLDIRFDPLALLGDAPPLVRVTAVGLRLHLDRAPGRDAPADWRGLLEPPAQVDIPVEFLRYLPDQFLLTGVELVDRQLAVGGPISLRVVERTATGGTLQLRADALTLRRPARSLRPLSLSGTLHVGPDRLDLADLRAVHPHFALDLNARYGARHYSARLDLRGRLRPLQRFAGLAPRLTGALHLRLDAARDPGGDRGRLDLDLDGFSYQWRPVRSLALRSRYQGGDMRIDSLRVDAAGGSLSGSGHLDLNGEGRPFGLNLAVSGLAADRLVRLAGGDFDLRGTFDGSLRALGRFDDRTLNVVALALDSPDLDLAGAALGPTHMSASYEAPHLRARLASRAGTLAALGRLDRALDHQLQWRLDGFDLSRLRRAAGSATLAGRLDLRGRSRGHLARPAVDLRGDLRQARWSVLQMAEIAIDARIDTSGALRLRLADPARALAFDLAGDLSATDRGDLRLSLADLPLRRLLTEEAAGPWRARVGLDLALSGSTDRPRVRSVFHLRDISYAGQLFGDARGTLDLAAGRSRLRVAALDSTVRLDGTLDLEDRRLPFDLAGRVRQAQLAPFLQLAAARPVAHRGRFSGAVRASGALRELADLDLDLDIDALQIHAPQGTLRATGPARIGLRRGVARIEGLDIAGPLGQLRLDGRIDRDGPVDLALALERFPLAALDPFVFARDRGLAGALSTAATISGHARAPRVEGRLQLQDMRFADAAFGDLRSRFTYDGGALRLRQFALQLPRGQLRGDGRVPLGDGAAGLRLDFVADGAVLDSLQGLPPGVELAADGRVAVRGPGLALAGLRGELALDTLALTAGPHALQTTAPLRLRYDRGLKVESLDLALAGGKAEGRITAAGALGPGRLRVTGREVDLAALGPLLGIRRSLAGLLDGAADLAGSVENPQGTLRWTLRDAAVDAWSVDRFTGRADYRDHTLRVDAMDLELAGGSAKARAVLPLTPRGAWRPDAPLSLELAADSLDLARLPLPHPELETFAGRGRLELRLAGTAADPRPSGRFELAAAQIKIRGLDPALRLASGAIDVGDGRLELAGFSGRAGDGRWALSGGARLAGVRPDTFAFSLDAEDLVWAVPGAVELASAGQLAWRGTPARSRLAGALQVARGKITAPINLRAPADRQRPRGDDVPAAGSGLDRVALDVALQLDRLQVANDLMEMELAGGVALRGHAAAPVLTGRVQARAGGTVYYLGQRFALDRAALDFRNPYALQSIYTLFYYPGAVDPDLDIAARTELKAKNGNEYFIDVGVHGPVSDLGFRLSSDPPRSHVEILSLLSFGRDDVQLLDPEGAILDRQNRVQLSPDYLMRVAQARFSRVFGVDRISIDESTFKPGAVGGTRITLSKQLSAKAEMTYSTSVGYASKGRVRLNYELDENVSLQTERDAEGESGMDLKLKLEFR